MNPRSLLLPKRIQNHEAHCLCAVSIFVHPVSVSALAAIRDRCIETSAQCVSANSPTPTNSSRGPCTLVLDRTPLVGMAGCSGLCPAWDCDCLDHIVVLNDRHLKRILTSYFNYYYRWRTHLSLGMDGPESRSVQLPALGKVVQFPEVGGLHHHYERLAA